MGNFTVKLSCFKLAMNLALKLTCNKCKHTHFTKRLTAKTTHFTGEKNGVILQLSKPVPYMPVRGNCINPKYSELNRK